LQVVKALEGRVVALDLVIGTDTGKGFVHRFVGVYAPWNPGLENNDAGFWNEVAKICNGAVLSWSLAGDLNATVSTTERASGGLDAKRHSFSFSTKRRASTSGHVSNRKDQGFMTGPARPIATESLQET
jgi:hypothetical protein